MNCPYCRHNKTEVYNSRTSHGRQKIWRRRRCLTCERVFTTYEGVDVSYLSVTKRSGEQQPYQRTKLLISLHLCCQGLTNSIEDIDALTDTIETKLLDEQTTVISSGHIAGLVLEMLESFSPAAYVRFLAYRNDPASNRQLRTVLQKL